MPKGITEAYPEATIRIRLIKYGETTAGELCRIFKESVHPLIDVEVVPAGCAQCSHLAHSTWPAISILAYDKTPSDREVSTHIDGVVGGGKSNGAIIALAESTSTTIARLLDLGALDVLPSPFRVSEVIGRISHWMRRLPVRREVTKIPALEAQLRRLKIIGQSSALVAELEKIPSLASSDATVLIQGETGTGKESCAQAIHYMSRRSGNPLLAVNWGAIQPDLAENELFGHTAGAYTGAGPAGIGLIEQAQGGTLFLDEIDSLPLAVQVKLLRFLQDRSFRALGASREKTADVRIIAATNGDLQSAVQSGRFRKDLYYRLNVLGILLPPLRARGSDIELLARHFLKAQAAILGRPLIGFTPASIERLITYQWPGNVRELQNVIERAAVLSSSSLVEIHALEVPLNQESAPEDAFETLRERCVLDFERNYLTRLLGDCGGNVSAAAVKAGKERSTFYRLLRKHKLVGGTLTPE